MARDYLLIIDPYPMDKEIKKYFSQLHIDIVQINNIDSLNLTTKLPTALIINEIVLKNHSKTIRALYKQYPIPIIISIDAYNEECCINMLEAGADDCLIKPLSPRELYARIQVIKRRMHPQIGKELFSFIQWRIYPSSRQVFNPNNQEIILSVGEYELLLLFIKNPQKILNREFLLHATKNTHLSPFDRRIDIQISRLRKKIELDANKPLLIKTIRNNGYLFTPSVIYHRE